MPATLGGRRGYTVRPVFKIPGHPTIWGRYLGDAITDLAKSIWDTFYGANSAWNHAELAMAAYSPDLR